MEDIIPGFIQGISRVCISYPFDVIKINMQKNKYNSSWSALKNILVNDYRKLYRGSTLSFISIPFDRSIQYYLLEKYKNTYNPYIIGFGTNLFSSIYNIPINYLCTNMILSNKKLRIIDLIKNNKKYFYYGSKIEICRSTMASSIYLGTYFNLREKYNKKNDIYISSLFGGISSILCWIVIFPLDGIRTDIQSSNNNNIKYHIKTRYKNHGIRNFYKGITPVLIRALPSNIISMYIYEFVRNNLKNINI